MKRHLILLFILLNVLVFPLCGEAKSTGDDVTREACKIIKSETGLGSTITQFLKHQIRMGEFDVPYDERVHFDPDIPDDFSGFKKDSDGKQICREYVKRNGQYGEVGKFIYEFVDPTNPGFSALFSEDLFDLPVICPRFNKFSLQKKRQFMVWRMTTSAFREYTCGKVPLKKLAQGPNGKLSGDFQLHFGNESQYSVQCDDYDSCSKLTGALCAAAVMNKNWSNDPKAMFKSKKIYWDVFRRGPNFARGGKNRPAFENCEMIASYKACGHRSKKAVSKACGLAMMGKSIAWDETEPVPAEEPIVAKPIADLKPKGEIPSTPAEQEGKGDLPADVIDERDKSLFEQLSKEAAEGN